MSLPFLACVFNVLLLSYVLQRVAAAGGMDNGSSSTSPNHPVIELIGIYDEDINPDSNYCQPPYNVRISSDDSSPSFASNERRLRLCPLPKSDKRVTEISAYDKLLKYCLFEVNDNQTFCEDEAKPCLTEPIDSLSCPAKESKKMYNMRSAFCFPFVEHKYGTKTYKKGIQGFLDDADQVIEYTTTDLYSYSLCYNKEQNKTEWAQRWVTPAANLRRRYDTEIEISTDGLDLEGNGFEKMRIAFEAQNKTSPDAMVPQRLVPKEDDSYLLWEINTSHYINVAPLWKYLVPLMNLINERIALLAHRTYLALIVRTYPYYDKSIKKAKKIYLDKYKEILIPNIWTITVYEPNSDSAINIVLHNTPNTPPISNEACKEAASCDFKKWISNSTTQSFRNITDEHTRYAYCCKTDNYESRRIENIININFEGKIVQN